VINASGNQNSPSPPFPPQHESKCSFDTGRDHLSLADYPPRMRRRPGSSDTVRSIPIRRLSVTAYVYEIHIRGQVAEQVLVDLRTQFGHVATALEPASTLITGTVPDQAALVGLLDDMHDLGLEVRELRRMADMESPAAAQPPRTVIGNGAAT
jgi:hypothetical protein